MLSPELTCFSSVTFQNCIKSNLKELQVEKIFCDVTIVCENQEVEAHKAVLAGGSLVFKNILKQIPQSHPLIFLSDVKFSYLLKILDFMYQGEVIIDQKEIDGFLSVARDLKVEGLVKDDAKDLKQSECFADEGNNRKKQRLVNSLEEGFNVDLKVHEREEVVVKVKKQFEHFAHETTNRKSQPMVTIPKEHLNLDCDIKTETDDFGCQPYEKIMGNNHLKDNIQEKKLRIRDIAKLSENTLEKQLLLIENDISQNVNSSTSNNQIISSSEKMFACLKCNKNYLRKSHLKEHMRSVHDGVTYLCDKCNFIAKRKDQLTAHIHSVHDGVTYPCDKCDYKAKWNYDLTKHIQNVHDGVTHPCDNCNFIAKSKPQLRVHIQSVHDGVTYPCDKCNFIAKRKPQLRFHINSVHDGVTYPCDKCDYKATRKYYLIKHIHSVHDGPTYLCDKCSFITKRKDHLKTHIDSVHDGVTYYCNKCEYKTKKKSVLNKHIDSIHGPVNYCDN